MAHDILHWISLVWEWTMGNILYINIFLSIIIVFFQRRDPASVWGWLLVLNCIPIVGFILYLLIGQNLHKNKLFKTKEIEDKINSAISNQEEIITSDPASLLADDYEDYRQMVMYNLTTASAMYTDNNSVDVFTDGNSKFDALIKDISEAESFIHIEYYIIKYDELFKRMEKVLIEKAHQGVEVRLLFDGMGARHVRNKVFNRLRKEGIHVSIFFPATLKRMHMRMDYRNHRKIAVIDGKIGYVGGFNIAREYIGLSKKFGFWRDTHFRILGNAVSDLQIRFILDWNYASKENLFREEKYFYRFDNKVGNIGMQIVSSGPDSTYQTVRDNYLKMIHLAKKNIYIQSPYFIPDASILNALKMAAQSGIDVRIMIPCKPDHPFVYWGTYSYAGEVIASGARVFTYQNGFLHVKGICVDGRVCSYGTANMDIRSFMLNFEVNAVVYDEGLTERMENIFREDLKLSKEMTKTSYGKRSLYIRFMEQVSRLLAPLL